MESKVEGDIKRLRNHINLLNRESKGELRPKKWCKLKDLDEKYGAGRKGMKTMIEELKQRMSAKSAKIKRYEQRIRQFRQNRLINVNQKKIYAEFNDVGDFR